MGVFISVAMSLTAWSGLLFTYIPYILLYSPMEINSEYENEEEALEMAMPGKDYGTGSVAPIIILMGVFVDTLLLAGTFKKYQIKTDLVKNEREQIETIENRLSFYENSTPVRISKLRKLQRTF